MTCLTSKELMQCQFQKDERKSGTLGFGGSIPCAQTKGNRTFYYEGQHPEQLMIDGDYEKLPIFFGSNSYEGSFVFGSKWLASEDGNREADAMNNYITML